MERHGSTPALRLTTGDWRLETGDRLVRSLPLRLAIVIPTLEEEEELAFLLPEARREAEWLIVSDGGSGDRTRTVAAEHGALVVRASAGRGTQLNRGALEALELGAEGMIFLHADTRLPRGGGEIVAGHLAGGCVGGGFYVRFDDRRPLLRLGTRLVNLRTRWTRLPLGDQAQFVRSEELQRMGGFREWPILEDLDFMWRLRKLGPIALADPPVITSGRRFAAQGVVRTVATNWLIWFLFAMGVSPERLGRLYGDIRGDKGERAKGRKGEQAKGRKGERARRPEG